MQQCVEHWYDAQVDAMLSRRKAEGEPDYLREVKNEFMAQWDGIRWLRALAPVGCKCHTWLMS